MKICLMSNPERDEHLASLNEAPRFWRHFSTHDLLLGPQVAAQLNQLPLGRHDVTLRVQLPHVERVDSERTRLVRVPIWWCQQRRRVRQRLLHQRLENLQILQVYLRFHVLGIHRLNHERSIDDDSWRRSHNPNWRRWIIVDWIIDVTGRQKEMFRHEHRVGWVMANLLESKASGGGEQASLITISDGSTMMRHVVWATAAQFWNVSTCSSMCFRLRRLGWGLLLALDDSVVDGAAGAACDVTSKWTASLEFSDGVVDFLWKLRWRFSFLSLFSCFSPIPPKVGTTLASFSYLSTLILSNFSVTPLVLSTIVRSMDPPSFSIFTTASQNSCLRSFSWRCRSTWLFKHGSFSTIRQWRQVTTDQGSVWGQWP